MALARVLRLPLLVAALLAPAFLRAEPRDPRPVAGETRHDAVVALYGSGTHTTVQAAIDAAPTNATAAKPFRILVKSGVYKEHVVVPADKPFLQLRGEPGLATETVITMDTNVKTPVPGADRTARVGWARELTEVEAAAYTVPNILGGSDGWNPAAR
jgi:pectin methylesterase-like acyl-CoA thioesterase